MSKQFKGMLTDWGVCANENSEFFHAYGFFIPVDEDEACKDVITSRVVNINGNLLETVNSFYELGPTRKKISNVKNEFYEKIRNEIVKETCIYGKTEID